MLLLREKKSIDIVFHREWELKDKKGRTENNTGLESYLFHVLFTDIKPVRWELVT